MAIYLHRAGDGPETVRLARWSIREFESGARHFVGHSMEGGDGRVSTAIVELDPVTRVALTASGRRYELIGGPGRCPDAEYVWNRVADAIGRGESWRDVTDELVPNARGNAGLAARSHVGVRRELSVSPAVGSNVTATLFHGGTTDEADDAGLPSES